MKVALVYDRVNKFGGAERVIQRLHHLYPQAPLYTLVHNPDTSEWSRGIKVIPSFFNKIKFFRTRHELLAPVANYGFEDFNLNQYDVVISVTSADAKAVITKPETLHICYCLTPTRYLWQGFSEYEKDIKMRLLPKMIKKTIRSTDYINAQRPDRYIAISDEVKRRIKKYYNRQADIIYPSIEDKFYSKNKPKKLSQRGSYLLVSRLVPYKKADLVIKTFNQLGLPLVVVGSGSEKSRLKSLAKSNISFLGQISDSELISQYRQAKALIFPQLEDFGLIPLEAQASGTPVIAYAQGGALETVVDQETGLFFKKQTPGSLIDAIRRFEAGEHKIKPSLCFQQAAKFSASGFNQQFSDKVKRLWYKHQNQTI